MKSGFSQPLATFERSYKIQYTNSWIVVSSIEEWRFGRARCPKCRHEFLVACKLRCICPSCHQKRELLWADWAAEDLLEDVPHRQVVLTIPKRLRVFFRYDRRLLGDLAACAWRAIRLYFQVYYDDDPILPGAVGFIATAGEFLGWNPHLHILLTLDRRWLFTRWNLPPSALFRLR